MNIKDLIKERVVVFDGAMGTEIQKRGFLPKGPVGDYLNIESPKLVEEIHLDYINSGADVIETNTFNSNYIVLSEYGREKDVEVLNRSAVQIAKSAVKKSNKNVYIAGSVGPLNISLSLGSNYSFDDVKRCYRQQLEILLNEGVDFIIFETSHDVINLKAGVNALIDILARYNDLPAILSYTLDKNGYSLSGHDVKSFYSTIMHYDLIAVGLNCSHGALILKKFLEELSKISKHPVFFMPNSAKPNDLQKDLDEFSSVVFDVVDRGIANIVGGCCGTTPSHIKLISEKIKLKKVNKPDNENFIVSHKNLIIVNNSTYIVGERMNMLGSKKFNELVKNSNYDGVIELAKSQIDKGSHLLDISFINKEYKEYEYFLEFFPKISFSIKNPFVIDTTDIGLWELSSKISGARLVFSSLSLEKKDEIKKVYDIIKRFGGVVVFSLIGENGSLPIRFDEKISNFKMILEIIKGFDFKTNEIIIDPLVFPILSIDYKFSARDTLLAVGEIKKYGFKTILGISNVSYGISKDLRRFINKKYFELSKEYGLDFAIINPDDLSIDIDEELNKELEKMILDGNKEILKEISKRLRNNNDIYEHKTGHNAYSDQEKLFLKIIKGNGEVEKLLEELLIKKTPLEIINSIVIPAMREVGRLFDRGDYIITDVLSSASVSKKVFNLLEPRIEKKDKSKLKMIIATVKGDVHDIGKNLVRMIFEANGFDVIDLGTQVEPSKILDAILTHKPHIIGLSGLIVRSLDYMIEVAKLMSENNINIPLILGGAAVSEDFLNLKVKTIYENSYYARDVIDGLQIALNILKEK